MALSTISGTTGITDATITSAKLADFSAAVDLNGVELLLDADQDTSISADTDDQIDIKIGGADDFQFTANTFTALSGSSVVIPDSGLTLGSTAVTSTAAELNLIDGGTSRGTTAVASGDGLLVNDAGTMRMTNVDTVSTYFASHNVGGTNIVTTGALNAGSITSGFGTIDTGSSTITTTGDITGGTFAATGDTAASDNASVGYTSAEGLILTGQGSTNDVTVKNDADADVLTIATGTTSVDIVGDVTASTLNADGDTAAGDNAAIGYTAGEGLILTGQGSTNDITIKNDADAAVISIPTGTTNATVAGTLTATSFSGSGANLTGIVSKGKNILINGAMQVAQRSATTVAQANDSNEGFATLDRWSLEFGNSAGGTITSSQDTNVNGDNGFGYQYKLNVTTADASISGNEIVFFRQTIEAQHMRSSGWDYMDSNSDITLSFWVYNSKTGTYCIALGSYDGTARMYTAEYTVSSANTWEKKTITIPGYSGLQFDADSNAGLTLYFMLANASGRQGSADAWTSGNAYGTSNQVNFLDSTSNVATFTGIQLEVGDSATDYEHRQYGEEFVLCQRYYQEHDGVKCQFSKLQMSDFDGHTQGFFCSHPTMRANPTLTRANQQTWYGNDSSWTSTSGKWALQPYNPTHIFTEGSYDGSTGNGVVQIKCDITLSAEI